ncbi:TauD/TfdA dioxygenase family protein [Candidatus Poriferisocius sp.]|uniref:TauD/TfdA dioxygenase family protein n=1 Tax=Candidatus Poriferisocius sp. TaxID=3101276 RepID=UPI003B58C718
MTIKVTPLGAALGATVEGLDAGRLEGNGVADELREAFWAHKVLFFPAIHLTDEQHLALGSVFGDLAAVSNDDTDHRRHDTVDDEGRILVLDSSQPMTRAAYWHTDVTFARQPPLGSLLSMKVSPPAGGDTMWANTQAAYEGLSEPIRRAIDGLTARHGRAGLTDFTDHPVVTVHPETGQRILFVNRGWTSSLNDLSAIESSRLLTLLCDHMERPEFTVRWRWSDGDAALWDNRCTMHYAINDYGDHHRRIHRVTIYDPSGAGPVAAPPLG